MEKKKVLVIDDEQIVLDSVRKILADRYEVETADNGTRGIKLALKNPCDIVLTDIRMPDVGGLIVLREIKRQKPSLPVMIITGYASVRSAVAAMKLGAADYIEKPFTPEQLAEAVATAIEREKEREPDAQQVIHKEEMLRVLERAGHDNDFRSALLNHGADALENYELTKPEMLAVITGDIHWIEEQIGPLTDNQKKWLEARLAAEIW
ncbi:response regulator [Desulfosudis oleivorans]|uniref:Response regulator receiver protein n=1 Tax=Desulfosudis oleivorans (strain DSM 6200 / JCM 39069 / Hxd3) TaxID=96561 RepID=A8ZVY7_DESOH|nr:response regulator [Desulfosudis oleivorans]ABW66696.1 response regulator receiver protein [Desulfosudis oleivorans Hxd3]